MGGRGVQPDPKGGVRTPSKAGGYGGVWLDSSNPVRRQFEGVFEASGHVDDMHAHEHAGNRSNASPEKGLAFASNVNAHRNGTLDVRRKGTPVKGLEGLSHDTRNWIPCLTKNGALLS